MRLPSGLRIDSPSWPLLQGYNIPTMRLCECGCGQEVRKRFVKGHQLRVVNPAKRPEVAKKIADWHQGRKLTEEHRSKISCALKGKTTWNKGLTKLIDKRVFLGSQNTSRALKGRIRPEEETRKAGDSNRGQKRSAEFRQKMSHRTQQYMRDPKVREAISARTRRLWADPSSVFNDPSYRKDWARRRGLKPTKPEMELLQIIEGARLPFKYVGDGQVIIGRKCPDFININGQKQLIELFGDYWHKGHNPQDRVEVFAKFGFSTLVIWAHELKEPKAVLVRLKEFLA